MCNKNCAFKNSILNVFCILKNTYHTKEKFKINYLRSLSFLVIFLFDFISLNFSTLWTFTYLGVHFDNFKEEGMLKDIR